MATGLAPETVRSQLPKEESRIGSAGGGESQPPVPAGTRPRMLAHPTGWPSFGAPLYPQEGGELPGWGFCGAHPLGYLSGP